PRADLDHQAWGRISFAARRAGPGQGFARPMGPGRRAGRRHAGRRGARLRRRVLFRVAPRRPPGRSPTVAGKARRGDGARRQARGLKDARMKRSGLIAAAAATLFVFALHQDVGAASSSSNTGDTYKQLNLFGDVFELVRNGYVDDVKDDTLVEGAINGMLTALDPHSNYLNSKNFNDMKVQTRGEFGGLGIEVSMESGLVKVVSPIDDTPAARAGLKPADLLTHLDGTPVQGLTLPEAAEKRRGPANSEITLTVRRA